MRYIALALATIAVGLLVHFGGGVALPAAFRDILGDALWAMMMAWWISALAPRARPRTRYLAAWIVCLAVEGSQLVHTPALDAARASRLGQLVLGSGFDPRDLAAYSSGVIAAALLDAGIVLRRYRYTRGSRPGR